MANIQTIRLPEQFSYGFFMENRYKISQTKVYEALCNNGFIKLYTPNARVYWHAQNEFGHTTPDWKFHISVKHQQLPQAWNLVAGLFKKMKCRSGMKTYYLKECSNPQAGRQITVYILKKSCFANDFELSHADEHSEEYWHEFVKNVESLLESHQIQPNGLAQGDFRIGKYVSLRNQAFVLDQKGEHIYPPNEFGWNYLKMELPINLNKLDQYLKQTYEQDENQQYGFSFSEQTAIRYLSVGVPIALTMLTLLGMRLKIHE